MQYNRASRTHGSANAQTIVSWTLTRAMHTRREKTALYQHIYVYILQPAFFFSITSTYVMNSHVGTKPARKSQQDPAWMAKKWLLRLFYHRLLFSPAKHGNILAVRKLGWTAHLFIFFFVIFTTLNSCHCKTAPKIYQCSCKIHKH